MKWTIVICLAISILSMQLTLAEEANLVGNSSFEIDEDSNGIPDSWRTSGRAEIKQELTIDVGRDGKRCARLECTYFEDDAPYAHVMICQVGIVSVRARQWYHLRFWAKGEDIKFGIVNVALTNTRVWRTVGLSDTFIVKPQWERYEMTFRSTEDLPAEASRLQFWFKSIGTFWIDDVVLIETSEGRQWYPQIPTDGVKNFVPNSSFECGAANWGSFTYGIRGWGGNLYRFYGRDDVTTAVHGSHSIKITLNPKMLPVFYFDYFNTVRQPIRRVLIANKGWFRVMAKETLTLSAFMRADKDGTVAQMVVCQGDGGMLRHQVKVGTKWQRYKFTFMTQQPFIYIAVGLDLDESKVDAATLWLDAIQLERGKQATEYEPRHTVEAFIETNTLGNIFTQVSDGITLIVRAFNNGNANQDASGKLVVTDFFDRIRFESDVTMSIPPLSIATRMFRRICAGRRGYFRVKWEAEAFSQSQRCAIIEPHDDSGSPIGMNHAYPWQFLVRLARLGGIRWWRDWSAKWHVVEPQKGKFNFTAPDEQILRIADAGAETLVLLPFPSAQWSTTASDKEIEKAANGRDYLRRRMRFAYAPRNMNDFGNYAAQVVKHYRGRIHAYQILNEPLYTTYALPMRFGHKLDDYLRILEAAYSAMKTVDPTCTIVGGIGAGPSAGLTRKLVEQGGLQFVDVLDLHFYRPSVPVEAYEDAFRSLWKSIQEHGGKKPIWITEYGCYADDDPPCVPHTVGDATMNRCKWHTERDASEHIVKFVAMTFAYGVRKIFFHSGTCGAINGVDANGVFFEYGGAPRKMYTSVAALTKLLGVPNECVRIIDDNGVKGYLFRTQGGVTAIVWRTDGKERKLELTSAIHAYDIMGNEMPSKEITSTATPIYLVSDDPDAVKIIQSISHQ